MLAMNISPEARPVAHRILLSRLLTRSGDQAWDFAVPLVLVSLLANGIQAAALYFLALRFGQVLLAPHVGMLVDRWPRLKAAKVGIGAQVLFMLAGLGLVLGVAAGEGGPASLPLLSVWFVLLGLAGLGASLGSLVTEIAVANDIVPTVIAAADLPAVNSRLKQIDLATEVGAPVLAGLLLAASPAQLPYLGFALVAVWNVASFLPEYLLVRSVILMRPELQSKRLAAHPVQRASLASRLTSGWRDFLRQPIMPAMLAYALLWLSVLSPHGILLAAFLKKGWSVPEPMIGLFRGSGAFFGLAATYLFPMAERHFGLLAASRAFIAFQTAMVALALVFFHSHGEGRLLFLGFVLLSRIGLYGFSIGETQIRQIGIPEDKRGHVNGFAAALTSIATLGLYGAGAVFAASDEFFVLVYGSVAAVGLAALVFLLWSWTRAARTAFQPARADGP